MASMPTLFISHGGPDIVINDSAARDYLETLSEHLPRPRAIVIVSAHFETNGVAVVTDPAPGMIYDFGGFAPELYDFLVAPLADVLEEMGGQRRLIFTALHEAFFTYIKVAFFAALFLSFPFIAIQVWMFIAPGLYKKEKRSFAPFLIATPILLVSYHLLVRGTFIGWILNGRTKPVFRRR